MRIKKIALFFLLFFSVNKITGQVRRYKDTKIVILDANKDTVDKQINDVDLRWKVYSDDIMNLEFIRISEFKVIVANLKIVENGSIVQSYTGKGFDNYSNSADLTLYKEKISNLVIIYIKNEDGRYLKLFLDLNNFIIVDD